MRTKIQKMRDKYIECAYADYVSSVTRDPSKVDEFRAAFNEFVSMAYAWANRTLHEEGHDEWLKIVSKWSITKNS